MINSTLSRGWYASLYDLTFAATSSAMLSVALPPVRIGALAWIALVPMLRLRRRVGPLRFFVLTFLAITIPAITLTRLTVTAYGFGQTNVIIRFAALVAVAAAFLFAAATVLAIGLERRVRSATLRVLIVPTFAVATELMLRSLLQGLAVPSLAWSQSADGLVAQSFYLFRSPVPITFLLVLVNAAIEESLESMWPFHRKPLGLGALAPALVALTFVSASMLYGVHRLAVPSPSPLPAVEVLPDVPARSAEDAGVVPPISSQ